MKKFLLLAFVTICIGIVVPCKAYSADITVGATVWYTQWDMEDVTVDPAFMYGPALAVKFSDDFNLTAVYLYGKFDMGGGAKISRNDLDLALNYRLNDYFKAFAGLKYMGYSMPFLDHSGIGPGLGLSATLPMAENLFLLATLSGFHLWGQNDFDYAGNVKKTDYTEYGMNSTLSLAYYIEPASTVVSLGGRFQYFQTHLDGEGITKNKFYGATLTATYTFGI